MNLVYYHPIALPRKDVFHECINPLISVMDRTTNHWPSFEYTNMFPMPNVESVRLNFMELCVNRIREICNTDKHINILWSGGIDSTFILALMIDLGIADELFSQGRLTIGLNLDSIRENPNFYNKFIKTKFLPCVVQASILLQNPVQNQVIITGEMADNLVGSLTMKSCVDFYNDFSTIHKPMDVAINWLERKLDSSEKKTALREFIDAQVKNSPVELNTCHDLLWYLNFNHKWQAVNFRIVSHSRDSETGNILIRNLTHFFNTEQFQQWSMQEGHYFTGDNWGDYKKVMKRFIYQVDGDMNYFKHKTKHPSLPALLRYKDTFDFIYEDNGVYTFSKKPLQVL